MRRHTKNECMEVLTLQDIYDVGDHYWGGDYYPSNYEAQQLLDILNQKIKQKLNKTKI